MMLSTGLLWATAGCDALQLPSAAEGLQQLQQLQQYEYVAASTLATVNSIAHTWLFGAYANAFGAVDCLTPK